jgi:hypothetical protein
MIGQFTDLSWAIWDFTNTISFAFITTLFFCRIDYKEPALKLVSFCLVCISYWSILALFVLTFITESLHFAWFTAFPLLTFSAAFYVFRKVRYDTTYCRTFAISAKDGCYLRYKSPRGLQGLVIVALGGKRGGGCSLIINAKEFCFSGGKVVERKHSFSTDGAIYERIGQIKIDAARQLVGKRWTIWRNCFWLRRFAVEQGALGR